LLQDANLVSAQDEIEALQDARILAESGWLIIKTASYKPQQPSRISIPIEAETLWAAAFGFIQPSDEEARAIRDFAWEPELVFLREARLNISFEELKRLDLYLKNHRGEIEPIPIKERSLEIFGDEKRLDMLYAGSALFEESRLKLETFHCFQVPEPLGWKRGQNPDGPIIILENLNTWESYCRWDAERKIFSAVVYGGGKKFLQSVRWFPELFTELGGARPLFYFGDLDATGLRIPRMASERARASGLPGINPHLASYKLLLNRAQVEPLAQTTDRQIWTEEDCAWLGDLAEDARSLFRNNQRIPQEWLGWNRLKLVAV
jgi:hypothetical protein